MKTKSILFKMVISIIFVLISSCSKNDNQDPENHFIYSSTDYPLESGILKYIGEGTGNGYSYTVALYSSGISWNSTDKILQGTGNLVTFQIFSSTSSALSSGNYVFEEDNTQNQGTFSTGFFGISFNTDSYSGTMVMISSGTMSVAQSGSTYEFTFNCLSTDNKAISGFYKGTLTYFDNTEK